MTKTKQSMQTALLLAGGHAVGAVSLGIAYSQWKPSSVITAYRNTVATAESEQKVDSCTINVPLGLPKPIVNINIVFACIVCLVIAGACQLYYGTDGFRSGSVTKYTRHGRNPLRWIERSVILSLGQVIIALTLGTTDAATLLLISVMNLSTSFVGLALEMLPRTNVRLFLMVIGWIITSSTWTVVVGDFLARRNDIQNEYLGAVDEYGSKIQIQTWNYWAILGQLWYGLCFAYIQWYTLNSPPESYPALDAWNAWFVASALWSIAFYMAYGVLYQRRECPPRA